MKDKNKKRPSNGVLALIITLVLVVGTILAILMVQNNGKKDEKTLAYTDLIKQVAAKNVQKVEMTTGSTSITVTLKKEIDEQGKIKQDGVEYKEEDIFK